MKKQNIKLTGFIKPDSCDLNNRTDYVKRRGWAIMPGEKKPDSRVAEEVAERLAELKL